MEKPLTAAQIISRAWGGLVPCGTDPAAAIEAHCWALKQWQSTGDVSDRPLADLTLRTVMFCRLAETADAQMVIDYLAALPVEAWSEHPEQSAEKFREATLDYLRRVIGWRQAG
ncbi:hypothetical protein IVB16_27355 [Bradyrhizobium sp. 183]|uniref:hypothetical protein n=1 Tax=unclassified Bradyrhizobium TaxID=2631580 RepID=UPI0020002BFE|nr:MULTISPECIES: hypothetical protein [unclassified Bradyrhizobium]UPJ78568.1 hypothetical protein IVB17_27355 [Bradyrhizobium sp. 184]UPJ86363.1 hypothetical protein IVB16_27355 [Bradyrhizobium sp. 183]